MKRIVVGADPVGALAVGTVLDERAATKAQGGRVPLLPVDELTYYRPDGCFARRELFPGWHYDGARAERGCPSLVVLSPDLRFLYWAALVVPIRPGSPMGGTLRATATGIAGSVIGGMSQETRPDDLSKYTPGPKGGIVVAGRCAIGVHSPTPANVVLHGLCTNAAVRWFAVSGGRESEEVPVALSY